MKKLVLLVALALFIPAAALAGAQVPNVTLKDPDGGAHNLRSLITKGGGVVVVTAPTYHDKKSQEGWSNALPATMPKGGMLIFIEDMSVSDWKSIARKDMKKEWKPGVPPMLLLDESGSTRKAMGVPADATVVFAFDKKGNQTYRFTGGPSSANAKTIWAKVK